MNEPAGERLREPTPPAERFSRAGMTSAGLFIALPFAAMGGATLLVPFVALAGIVGAPWMRLHRAVRVAGLPLLIAALFLGWVVLSATWSKTADLQSATDIVFFVACALLFLMSAGNARLPDRILTRRASVAGVALLAALVAIETQLNFPIGRELAPVAKIEKKDDEKKADKPVVAATEMLAKRSSGPVVRAPEDVFREQAEAASAKEAPATIKKVRDSNPAIFQPDAARAALIALLCLWGAGVGLWRFGWRGQMAFGALFALTAWTSHFYGGINVAALALGSAAALIALIWPRAVVSMLTQFVAALIVVAPVGLPIVADLAAQALKQAATWGAIAEIPGKVEAQPSPLAFLEPSFGWLQRAETWRFAAEQIQKQIPLGYGFGSSANFQQTYVLYTPSYSFTLPYIPGHPLSAPIQIWLETGAVGAVLAAAALATFGRRVGAAVAHDRIAAAAAAGLLVATAFIMTVSGWTWSLWWWSAVAVGAALIRAAKRPT